MGAGIGIVIDLPGLLTGALAVSITEELAFGTAGLGAAIAAVRATATVVSFPVGRVADNLGATNALRLAAGAAIVAGGGIALFATNWAELTLGLVVSGVAIAIGHPAANRLLSRTVPPSRQGVAFGIKQAAPPTASLLAGISVPAIALTFGWRWAFGVAAIAGTLMLLAVGRRPAAAKEALARERATVPTSSDRPRAPARPRAGMVWLGLGFGLGTASAVVVPAFYVDAAVRSGISPALAGTMLAVASAATIGVRVSMGFVADRMRHGHFRLCGALLSIGAIGLVLLGTGGQLAMMFGVVLAASALWGFNGVFWFAVIQIGRDVPGTITGLMSPGGHLGGSVGPLVFGILATTLGYSATWLTWTSLSAAGAASMFMAARHLRVALVDEV